MYKGCQCTTVTKIVNEEGGGAASASAIARAQMLNMGLGLGECITIRREERRTTVTPPGSSPVASDSELRVANPPSPATLTFILHGAQARVAEKKAQVAVTSP